MNIWDTGRGMNWTNSWPCPVMGWVSTRGK